MPLLIWKTMPPLETSFLAFGSSEAHATSLTRERGIGGRHRWTESVVPRARDAKGSYCGSLAVTTCPFSMIFQFIGHNPRFPFFTVDAGRGVGCRCNEYGMHMESFLIKNSMWNY